MTDIRLKILALFLAVFQPFIMMCLFGEHHSLSQYWSTAGQPLFIITNAMTSYFLFSTNQWFMPAISLLLLTAFSVDLAPATHNIFAATFFITSTFPIIRSKRFWWYIVPYVFGGLIALWHLLFGEIIVILCICFYHAHVMYYLYQLKKS